MISLVEGDPGGNKTPSPILGHMGEEAEGPLAPTPPAPQSEIAAPAREESKTGEMMPKPVSEPEQAQPAPQKPEAIPVAPKKLEEAKPEEKVIPKPKEQEKPEPKKQETKP